MNDSDTPDAASESNGASEPPRSTPPTSSASSASESPAASSAEAAPELVKDPLETAKADAQKFREQLLRTAADFDNFRKRARRDQEDAQRRGRETTVKDLLPVFDNLERAASSADTAPTVKSVADGIRMVLRQFTGTLERMGIKRINCVGQPFDPSLHEAIQHVDSNEHPAGVIAHEVQPGYQLNEHLLRAAMVMVSQGPPKSAAEPEAKPSDSSSETVADSSDDDTPIGGEDDDKSSA
jgi:molecular chaperone GrpE